MPMATKFSRNYNGCIPSVCKGASKGTGRNDRKMPTTVAVAEAKQPKSRNQQNSQKITTDAEEKYRFRNGNCATGYIFEIDGDVAYIYTRYFLSGPRPFRLVEPIKFAPGDPILVTLIDDNIVRVEKLDQESEGSGNSTSNEEFSTESEIIVQAKEFEELKTKKRKARKRPISFKGRCYAEMRSLMKIKELRAELEKYGPGIINEMERVLSIRAKRREKRQHKRHLKRATNSNNNITGKTFADGTETFPLNRFAQMTLSA